MSVFNPSIFKGEQAFGTTAGAPLSTDSNNQVTSGISNAEATATASATAPLSTDALMTGMSVANPVAGTYLVAFSCDVNSTVAGAVVSVSIYIGGVQKADSLRKLMPFSGGTLTSGSQRMPVSTNGIVTVNGSQNIEIWWSTSNTGPTAAARTLDIVRLA